MLKRKTVWRPARDFSLVHDNFKRILPLWNKAAIFVREEREGESGMECEINGRKGSKRCSG